MKNLNLIAMGFLLFAGAACSHVEKSPDRDVASTPPATGKMAAKVTAKVTAKGLYCADNMIDSPTKVVKLSYDKGEWFEGRNVRRALHQENLVGGVTLRIESTMDDFGRGDIGRGTISMSLSGVGDSVSSEAHFNVSARDLTENYNNEVISLSAKIDKQSVYFFCKLVK